jgi:hypothetical protein
MNRRLKIGLATLLLGLGAARLPSAAGATVFISEDFEGDTVGAAPANATFIQLAGANSLAIVVDDGSTPANPIGPAGNKSLLLRDRINTTDIRASFKGSLPDEGITQGKIAYQFHAVNAAGDTIPVVSMRAGLNDDASGGSRIDNSEAAFLLSFEAASNRIVILEGGVSRILQQTWAPNVLNNVAIEFDAVAQTWGASLNGVTLTKSDSSSQFSFWSAVGAINQFDFVTGAGSNIQSTVFFDNLQVTGVPEPSVASLTMAGILVCLGPLRRKIWT